MLGASATATTSSDGLAGVTEAGVCWLSTRSGAGRAATGETVFSEVEAGLCWYY
jgi:hypothetical protein